LERGYNKSKEITSIKTNGKQTDPHKIIQSPRGPKYLNIPSRYKRNMQCYKKAQYFYRKKHKGYKKALHISRNKTIIRRSCGGTRVKSRPTRAISPTKPSILL